MTQRSFYFDDLTEPAQLGRLALRSGVISVASTYGSGVLQIAAAIILARLLTPEDFGLVAIVTVLTSFAPFLIDFGLGDVTTQRSKITQGEISTLFWISSGIGVAIAVAVAVCSPVIAGIYREPRLQSVALYYSITFVLLGMSGQHLSLLRRTMQFAAVAKIQILSALVGLAISIPVAISGYGYWALVLRPIVSALCIAVGAWLACGWRPGLPVVNAEVGSMVRFGMHVLGYSIVASLARAIDRIALGLFYPPREVGFYQTAVVLYENSIFSSLAQLHSVGSTALGKLQSNPAGLRQKYELALSTLAFFVMPAAAILSVTAEDLVVILLGEKWRASGLLLSIIALRGIFHVVQGSHGWLHLSTGRPDRWKNWGIVTAVVQVIAVVAGLPFGANGVAIAFVVAGSLIAFPSVSYAGRPVGISWASMVQCVGRQLLGAIITAAAGWWLQAVALTHLSSLCRIILSASFCITIYLLIVVGLFRLSQPIRVAGGLLLEHLPARALSWFNSRA